MLTTIFFRPQSKKKKRNIPKVFYCQNFDFKLVSIVLVKRNKLLLLIAYSRACPGT